MANKTYPELANLSTRLQELDSRGYTVFPDYLDRDTTAAIRAHIDTKYRDNFPDSLRQGLPLELQSLLD